ncbi:4521_t:CDS:2 [Acaulospora morrowiae]|uniref:Transcription initiation factor IIF subunit beta n=1 Tax=Acaulospora morrowiae TaxID=94023 RepID=A0A9N8WV31_9GLOM|nr:4521_t:CDS:2 [Acaulospora morrowiae]
MEESFDHESLNEEEFNGEMTDAGYENDEDEGDLDMKDIGEEAWLIKLPLFLYEKWADLDDESLELARVRVYSQQQPYGPDQYKLVIAENDLHKDLPKEYELDIINQGVPDSYCFCQDVNADTLVSLSGTIKATFNMKPSANDVEYNKKLRERTMLASKPERTIRILEEEESRGAYVPPGGSSAAVTKFSNLVQKKAKVTMEQKTTRIPKHELLDLLFGAFSRYMYWSFRGLKDYAKQPESYLKEVLSEIAVLDKKGPYNNCYHLKPEYNQKESASISIAPQGLEAPTANVGSGDEQPEFDDDDIMLDQPNSADELFGYDDDDDK